MSRPRLLFICIIGILLLSVPTLSRLFILGYQPSDYQPPELPLLDVAVTPIPTVTPNAPIASSEKIAHELPPGPIVVDLAHFNRLNRSQFQPLAAALAERGFGLQFWQSDIDPLQVESFADFPDQSTELAELLKDARGLVIVSPYFLWSSDEIAVVKRFVQDGGHLLLISDPDIVGDVARDINNIGEPFGVVFNEDYLYDTADNDENHTHIFLKTFLDQAAIFTENETESKIAFYGTRSIDGSVVPQMTSGDTTLSSIRIGLNHFTTVAIGGQESNQTNGRVLAMSDFNVLTEPYVERHNNRQLLSFVANFLTDGQREASIADFPTYFGEKVSLIYGSQQAMDAALLKQSARLQQQLEATGRTLEFIRTAKLTETAKISPSLSLSEVVPNDSKEQSVNLLADLDNDLIYLTNFEVASIESALMDELALNLIEVEEVVKEARVEITSSLSLEADSTLSEETISTLPISDTDTISVTDLLTAITALTTTIGSPEIISMTAPITAIEPMELVEPMEPLITRYIETESGLRLLATETVFLVQRAYEDGRKLVAILGSDSDSISSGVDRLLNANFADCILQIDQAICPFVPNVSPTEQDKPTVESTQKNDDAESTPQPEPSDAPSVSNVKILVLDDDDQRGEGEPSEADLYIQILTGAGYEPTLWRTSSEGIPDQETLLQYEWVLWSSGNYPSGGPELENLNTIFDYISEGGRISISSRNPFFGESVEEPSQISDIVIDESIPELIAGFPTDSITLVEGSPPVIPLVADPESSPDIVLRRGPNSENPNAPLLFVLTDVDEPEPTGARLLVLAMSVSWLPEEYAELLVLNLAEWMLEE